MAAPKIGDRVKYKGSTVSPPDGFIEDPVRLEREGEVVYGKLPSGEDIIDQQEGTWPVTVKWDNGDPTQTCFEGEVVKIESA